MWLNAMWRCESSRPLSDVTSKSAAQITYLLSCRPPSSIQMYNSSNYGADNPASTNNPFLQNSSHPNNRYPDPSEPLSQPQSQWTDNDDPTLSTGPQPQYQPDTYQRYPTTTLPLGYTPQPPQIPSQSPIISGGYGYTPQPPQIPSQSSSISGGYGYLQSGQPPLQPEYNLAQQQVNSPNYVSQLDPFKQLEIPQGWDAATSQSQQPFNSTDLSTFGYGQKRKVPPKSRQLTNDNFEYGNTNRNNQNNSLGYSSGYPDSRRYIRTHEQEVDESNERLGYSSGYLDSRRYIRNHEQEVDESNELDDDDGENRERNEFN